MANHRIDDDIRRTPGWVIALVIGVGSVLTIFANRVIVPRHWTVPISHATGGRQRPQHPADIAGFNRLVGDNEDQSRVARPLAFC